MSLNLAFAEPTFEALQMDLDKGLAMLQHARDHVLHQASSYAAWNDRELAATLSTLHDCARWVGQIRRLNGCVDSYLDELATRAAAPFKSRPAVRR